MNELSHRTLPIDLVVRTSSWKLVHVMLYRISISEVQLLLWTSLVEPLSIDYKAKKAKNDVNRRIKWWCIILGQLIQTLRIINKKEQNCTPFTSFVHLATLGEWCAILFLLFWVNLYKRRESESNRIAHIRWSNGWMKWIVCNPVLFVCFAYQEFCRQYINS